MHSLVRDNIYFKKIALAIMQKMESCGQTRWFEDTAVFWVTVTWIRINGVGENKGSFKSYQVDKMKVLEDQTIIWGGWE